MKKSENDRRFWQSVWRTAIAGERPGPDAPTWKNDRDREIAVTWEPHLPERGTIAENIGQKLGKRPLRTRKTRSQKL